MNNRLPLRFAAPVIAGLLFASSAGAQAPLPASDASSDQPAATFRMPRAMEPATPAAPAAAREASVPDALSRDGLRAGVRAPVAHEATASVNEMVAQRSGLSHGQVLMIVGGAALLTGAIIGDDAGTLIMIGGAGIGLWGLYLYLQ